MNRREHWRSRLGFIWAATGSAVGLGSIWRFPYVVGENGGATFVALFCCFLFCLSFPILLAEVLVGRKTQMSPAKAFVQLGHKKIWKYAGIVTILTGFIISSFYSVICGWTLGYLIEALLGKLTQLTQPGDAALYFQQLSDSPSWSIGWHFVFMTCAAGILYVGVRKGIESANTLMMPLLFLLLILLAIKGISTKGSKEGLLFIFAPDWSKIQFSTVMTALGQAFFALSLGQGTMVTYGSYLNKRHSLVKTCFPIACSVIIVSLLAGIAIFTIVFAVGVAPDSGPNLMFQTLPLVFSQITGGYFFSVAFFLLIFFAALTSQISAMEPSIAYLVDSWRWKRHQAVLSVATSSFLLGIPSALAFGLIKKDAFWGDNFFTGISFISVNILVPLGGLLIIFLVGWRWGIQHALFDLTGEKISGNTWKCYWLNLFIRYLVPLFILAVLLTSLWQKN